MAVAVSMVLGAWGCGLGQREEPAVWRSPDPSEGCTSHLARLFDGRRGTAGRTVALHLRVDVFDSIPDTRPDSVTLILHAEHPGDDAPADPPPPLTLVLDDTARLVVPGRQGRSLFRKTPEGGQSDRVDYRVSVADLRRLASAGTVEGDAGIVRFTLGPRETGVARTYAAYVTGARSAAELPVGGGLGPDCISWQDRR